MYYGGIMERQMRRIFDQARRLGGNTGTNLLMLLECRLDTVVWRLGFAPTIFAARQMVNHCHVLVNGQKVNIPSYLVKPGMVISIRQRSRDIGIIKDGVENPPLALPEYLQREAKSFEGKLIATPNSATIPVKFDTTSIIGFYSR
ncbi:MAG: 30S ribosomal protein S4 [Candidatus Hydrogenedentes bacterium ADurb.Bin101]|nr:MAG: 30S ribosomal protein S4 [Candidatus Hydrogenedentes bacterium ADurb.Bin101]